MECLCVGLWPSLSKACSFCLVLLFKDEADTCGFAAMMGPSPSGSFVFRMLWEGLVTDKWARFSVIFSTCPRGWLATRE